MSSDKDAADKTDRTRSSPDRISNEALLTELQRLHDDLGRVPKVVDMRRHGTYSYGVYYKRFGSWVDAISEAGFETEQLSRGSEPIPEKKLLAELRRLHDDLERVPKTTDMSTHGEYSDTTYRNRFGSWDEAILEAGFDPTKIQRGTKPIPEEDLLTELHHLSDEVGDVPRKIDMDTYGEYSANTYACRFGSWFEALEEAGLR